MTKKNFTLAALLAILGVVAFKLGSIDAYVISTVAGFLLKSYD